MQIQQIIRDDAEKVFISVKNVDGSTITTGMGVAHAIGGNSFDGVNVVRPASGTAANLPGFVGIATGDIPVNGIGLVQSYGWANSVLLSNVGTSLTITKGDPLVPGAQAGALFSGAPTYANGGLRYVVAGATAGISASGYTTGFVRAL